jgi:glutathione S-transferase
MTPGSCSTGIHIILEELEEIFEVTIVNLLAGDQYKPDYAAMSPKSTVPVLVKPDGGVLTEVPAIAHWLARTHPRAGLWPANIELETRLWEIMCYVTGTLHGQGFARIFVPQSFARSEVGQENARRLGHGIVERGFAILGAMLDADSYIAGHFSVADAVLFYVLFWADKTNIPLPRSLAAHYRRMLTRPAVRLVLREEGYNPDKLGQFLEGKLLA